MTEPTDLDVLTQVDLDKLTAPRPARHGEGWSAKERDELRMLWGIHSVAHIARMLNRSESAVYNQARLLDIGAGCPQGFEYLSNAAARAGYHVGTLRKILRWGGVRIWPAASRPADRRRRHRGRHVVEPSEVDAAVARWCATETIEVAARRYGYSPELIRRRLVERRDRGELTLPDRTPGHPWRVPRALIDETMERYTSFEDAETAARRHGVSEPTLRGWLREAGIVHSRALPKRWLDPGHVDRVVEARRAKVTVAEAARQHGRSEPYIMRILKRAMERGEFAPPPHARGKRWLLSKETVDGLVAAYVAEMQAKAA